jgi:fluoroquinolone transport system ATP-binding protein
LRQPIVPMPATNSTMIEVRDLTYTYLHAKSPAIDHLNFSVEEGEIFGFLGPSGAGKSTTQRLLIHLLEGYGGEARVRKKDLTRWTSADYETIGVGFETPNHFSRLTGLENLHYFAALYRRPTRSPAALLDLVGLESDGDRRVAEYSKGMKTRLGIARALLHNPEILFLDEPTIETMHTREASLSDVFVKLTGRGLE